MGSKKTLVLFMCVLLILAFSKGIWAAEKSYNIVFSVKNIVNIAWKGAWIGAQKTKSEYKGVNLTYTSPTKSDNIAEQMSQMEDIILKRPDAIVFIPVDFVALVPTVQKMNKANIPVFTYCSEPAGGKFEIFVGADDEKLAYAVGSYAIKQVGGKAKVVILDGVPGSYTTKHRHAGFEKAIMENPGASLLISQTANYNRLMAMQVIENLLQRFPDMDLVFAGNDEMAMGAVEAIDAVGKLGKIQVIGIDANDDAAQAVAKGRLLATCDYGVHDQAYLATKAAIKYLKGEKIPKRISLPAAVVTKENAGKYTIAFEKRGVPNWDALLKDRNATTW